MKTYKKYAHVLLLSTVLSVVSTALVQAADKKVSAAKKVAKKMDKNIDVSNYFVGQEPDLKVRYIDSLKAMQASKEGQDVSAKLEKKRKELSDKIAAEEAQLAKAMEEYKTKASTLSDTAREKEEQKLVKMEREYKNLVQASEDELKLAMQRATERLAKEVDKAVAVIAKRDGLDAVVDIATGRTLYASEQADYTQKVVVAMDGERTDKAKALATA